MFRTIRLEKNKGHILCLMFILGKSYVFCDRNSNVGESARNFTLRIIFLTCS